jgi:hypothetical protein
MVRTDLFCVRCKKVNYRHIRRGGKGKGRGNRPVCLVGAIASRRLGQSWVDLWPGCSRSNGALKKTYVLWVTPRNRPIRIHLSVSNVKRSAEKKGIIGVPCGLAFSSQSGPYPSILRRALRGRRRKTLQHPAAGHYPVQTNQVSIN